MNITAEYKPGKQEFESILCRDLHDVHKTTTYRADNVSSFVCPHTST
jgi:hypothetical protein